MSTREEIEQRLDFAKAMKQLISDNRSLEEENKQLHSKLKIVKNEVQLNQISETTLNHLMHKMDSIHEGNRLIAEYLMKQRGDL